MKPQLSESQVSPADTQPTVQIPAEGGQPVNTPEKPKPRLHCADRETLVPAMRLEDLLTPEHHARTVWQFVQGLDLTPLLNTIRAVEGGPRAPAINPQIPVALWLLATIEGIGSPRALDYLCGHHHAFRWLCGGVSVNYHTLADFRVHHLEFLDGLLTHSVATLMAEDLVDLNRVAHDGMRIAPVPEPPRFAAGQRWTSACSKPKHRSNVCGRNWRPIQGKPIDSKPRLGNARPASGKNVSVKP